MEKKILVFPLFANSNPLQLQSNFELLADALVASAINLLMFIFVFYTFLVTLSFEKNTVHIVNNIFHIRVIGEPILGYLSHVYYSNLAQTIK